MPGFIISVLLCAGSSCDMVPVQPEVLYPTREECAAALESKGKPLTDAPAARQHGTRDAELACVRLAEAIADVQDRYDVLETVLVHAGPSASSAYVGAIEAGERLAVFGLVDGTGWMSVRLADGTAGFVPGDDLRKTPGSAPVPPAGAPGLVAAAVPLPAEPASGVDPATAQAAPGTAGAIEMQDCSTCPTLVRVLGGSFSMGSNLDASERPAHRVSVPTFAIGKTVVTAAEWGACVAGGGCAYKPPPAGDDPERRPMGNLSWNDATQYVRWLRQETGKPYRLPSEAEWEYAARAGAATRYSWGDRPKAGRADCNGCGGARNLRGPADVTSYPANAWGLAGVEGGLAQWVEDCWHPTYQAAPVDGSPWLASKCARRVLRGGSWTSTPSGVTVSDRIPHEPGVRRPGYGLRVALTLQNAN